MKREGFLPSMDGINTAIWTGGDSKKIMVGIKQSIFELDYMEAIALANQIMTTVEVFLRESNAKA